MMDFKFFPAKIKKGKILTGKGESSRTKTHCEQNSGDYTILGTTIFDSSNVQLLLIMENKGLRLRCFPLV